MKDRIETGIFKCFKCFLRMWKTREIYTADKIGERAETCSMPMSTLKKEEEKLFYEY